MSNSLNYLNIFISILGALAWFSPWVYEYLRRSKLYGKVIYYKVFTNSSFQYTDVKGENHIKNGIPYLFKISIVAIHKNFYLDKTKVYVKYKNESQNYKGEIIFPSETIITNDNNHGMKLIIKKEDMISSVAMFECNKKNIFYVQFVVDKATNNEPEYFEFKFYTYNNENKTIRFNYEQIASMYFSDDIWEPLLNGRMIKMV